MIEGLVRVNLNPEAVESVVVELLLVALDSEFVAPYKFGLHAIHDLLLDPYEADCYDRCYAPAALLIVVPSALRHEAILSNGLTGLFCNPILVSSDS